MIMNNVSGNKGGSKIVADTKTSKRKHILFDKIPWLLIFSIISLFVFLKKNHLLY